MIYFIGNCTENICKIGVSVDVDKRLKEIQCSCPFDIEILQCFKVSDDYLIEKSLHVKYEEFNIRGEWFKLSKINEIECGINEEELKLYLISDTTIVNNYDVYDLIKWSELSRKLSGSDNSIRPNKVPKKYEKKVNRLLKIIELWLKWI